VCSLFTLVSRYDAAIRTHFSSLEVGASACTKQPTSICRSACRRTALQCFLVPKAASETETPTVPGRGIWKRILIFLRLSGPDSGSIFCTQNNDHEGEASQWGFGFDDFDLGPPGGPRTGTHRNRCFEHTQEPYEVIAIRLELYRTWHHLDFPTMLHVTCSWSSPLMYTQLTPRTRLPLARTTCDVSRKYQRQTRRLLAVLPRSLCYVSNNATSPS
jgi:hypothetical protein